MNAAQRSKSVDGPWNVFNAEGTGGGRYGKKVYLTAGFAVAHRLGIGGHKGERFARSVNEALLKFMIEAIDERKTDVQ